MQMTCPKCHGEMRIYERSGVTVDQCTECRGIFLDRGELEKLFDAEASFNSRQASPQAQPRPTAPPPGAYTPPPPPVTHGGYAPPPAYGQPAAYGQPPAYGQPGAHQYPATPAYGHHGHYRQHHGHYRHNKRQKSFLQGLFD